MLLVGCGPKEVKLTEKDITVKSVDNAVVITVDADAETDGESLEDVMNILTEAGKLSYEASNGMVGTINDKTPNADANEFWALYTDDEAVSDAQFGSTTLDGKTYLSAALGMTDLKVKAGFTYVWSIATW